MSHITNDFYLEARAAESRARLWRLRFFSAIAVLIVALAALALQWWQHSC